MKNEADPVSPGCLYRAICLSCLMLLDCVLLCEALRSYFMQQFKGCDLMHVLLWLVSVPLCAPLTVAVATQPCKLANITLCRPK